MIPKETLSLLRRLQSGIGRWPVNSSRKGRDLGEFLRTTYEQTFKELVKTDPMAAEAAVRSLERLVSDHHRNLYSEKGTIPC
ncbi:Ubiquinol-cytochrome-c reductase complex assembly factor 2 [Geodia barretti]|nr:Ubiquinol-cytochrome-c reductase complex assembly factor 2 [Geodia barretti]